MKLSALHTKNLTSILNNKTIQYSPTFGLLTSNCPGLLANLRNINNTNSSKLVKDMFYQRTDASGVRYGPVSPTGSKSLPLFWLQPNEIGTILGLSIINNQAPLKDNEIDKQLLAMGIETNHYKGKWTGVSLERYRKPIRLLSDSTPDHSYTHNYPTLQHYSLNTLLYYVWCKSSCRGDLLEFILSLERTSQQEVIQPSYSDLRTIDSTARKVWIDDMYTVPEVSNKENVTQALHHILYPSSSVDPSTDHNSDLSTGLAWDLVAASLTLEKSVKPPLKLGRYAYTGSAPHISTIPTNIYTDTYDSTGTSTNSITTTTSSSSSSSSSSITNDKANTPILSQLGAAPPTHPSSTTGIKVKRVERDLRPDCVEVVIREVIDCLLYGKSMFLLCILILYYVSQ